MEQLDKLIQHLIDACISLGYRLVAAVLVYAIGRYLVHWLNKAALKIMERRKMEPEVQGFVKGVVAVFLNLLLAVAVIGALGIETTSFAALLAALGAAIGMALSGQMQNFAGGIIILINKPYKIGDFIATNGMSGNVVEIGVFSTILRSVDNITYNVPNGIISSNPLTNFSQQPTRRIDFSVGVEYGTSVEQVRESIMRIIADDARILADPEPFIALGELADSSVNITVRVWVKTEDYWPALFNLRETVYRTFNKEGIGFPFPQLTVHQA